ncbi:hypothetical protein M9H77_27113 [Catharanthus roseus]|uniref:Uncharacterized protein n=1 Tax=Catharanthus roseus TaxID=4058 RepID=A0ACC0AD64_CATRO|nr:hypothetical protein M9H77_27113 [Catharanthus roseus]
MDADAPPRKRKTHKKNLPRTSISLLPNELIIEILLKLPPEIVYKFQSVCSKWRSLTSTPYFIETHLNQQKVPAILFQENTGCSELEVFFMENWTTRTSPKITIVRPNCISSESWKSYQTCLSYNGLIILKGSQNWFTDFVIYNPVNHEAVRILNPGGGDIYGMFFHPILRQYCILWGLFQTKYVEFKMLNLGPKPKWKEIKFGGSSVSSYAPLFPSLHIHDNLYWIAGYKNSPNCEEFILILDIIKEKFSSMGHPELACCRARGYDFSSHHKAMNLLKKDSSLSFIHFCRGEISHSISTIHIWILSDDVEKNWVKTHTIKEVELKSWVAVRGIAYANGELLIHWDFVRFYVLNLEEGSIRIFGRNYRGCMRALDHFKSLVSLKDCKPEIKMEEEEEEDGLRRRTRVRKAVKYC